MEKLIELLKEYDEYRGEKRRDYGWTKDKVELDVKMIIFKKFGFIKWLVENDKVNKEKVKKEAEYYWTDEYDVYVGYVFYHRLLMLLSISDTPIEDLISYLHE